MATKSDSITAYPAEFISDDYSYASIVSSYPATNPIGKGSTNTSMSRFNLKTGSRAVSYVYYRFDLSDIPTDATINSISCSAKVYISQTNSNRISTRQVQMFSGTTAKGSASTMSTSTTALNLSCGSWTRSELNDCRIRLYAVRGTSSTSTTYYMGLYGATLTVNYTYEDVQYVITTTVTGGTINPENPSVSKGSSQTFNISGLVGTEELDSLTLDGTDILSQAIRKENTGDLDYEVQTVSGASYTFVKSGNYYVSNNKGKSSSAALAKVFFNLPVECSVNFYVINYAEATYDYGLLSNIDTNLSTSASADSSGVKWNGRNANSANEQTVSYTIPSGEHFVTVKYFKDSYTDSNNDTLQFRVEITPNEPLPEGTFYYEYTLIDVQSTHLLVAVFGDAPEPTFTLYLKQNGSWVPKTGIVAYKKINGQWVIQNDISKVFDSNTKYVKG